MRANKTTIDFIVIGAQKAGTTALFEYLRRHPELWLPSDKEAPYFSHDRVRARGWDLYIKRAFFSANEAHKWGTVTTHYMVGGVYEASSTSDEADLHYDEYTVPLRIRKCLPNVRLIAVLRDPVARALSHHRMMVMNGIERRTFDDAINELLRSEALMSSRRHPQESSGYVTWGEYGRILSAYLDVFPREQILVVFSSELEREPAHVLRRVHEFIGVSADTMPDNLGARYRESRAARRFSGLSPEGIQSAVAQIPVARKLWRALPEDSKHRAHTRFRNLSYRVDLWNQRGAVDLNGPRQTTVALLREHYERDDEQLQALLDTELPWRTPPPS